MNQKILTLVLENLQDSFKLKRYSSLYDDITEKTRIEELPWTPARFSKYKKNIHKTLGFYMIETGTVEDIVNDLDTQYSNHFFSKVWVPRNAEYDYTGFKLADVINEANPKSVLDVGCGYHPYKELIPNLVGIDPYNDMADYMVDILEYAVEPESHDNIIALGSINFNSKDDIEQRFSHCVNLLQPGGKFYLRANPGIPHKTGPWVDIFPWNFAVAKEFEKKYNLFLETFKKDALERLFFVYTKL
jgi:hypothetical protein